MAAGCDIPNAKYIFHKKEYAVWEAEHARGANPPGTVFRDNCLPIVEAARRCWSMTICAGRYHHADAGTPGHSPCHCCVNIFSRGQRAVVTADMMHHVISAGSRLVAASDWDGKQAAGIAPQVSIRRRRYDTLLLRSISRPDRGIGDRRWGQIQLPVQAK